MNLMQILNDDVLGFKMEIKRLNDSHMQTAEGFDLNALPGSPALRRGVSQAMKVLDDIVSVAGKAPEGYDLQVTILADGIQADGVGSNGKTPMKDAWGVTPGQLN